MLCPFVLPRVKQRNDLAGFRINASQIRAFLQVAMPTGEREVVMLLRATVLRSDNVFDVERPAESLLRHARILAPVAGRGVAPRPPVPFVSPTAMPAELSI